MEALEKAKLALRKHLLENKDKVVADLNDMRMKSEGNDIFQYIENASSAFSLGNLTTSKEILYDYSFMDFDCYNLINELLEQSLYSPPDKKGFNETKKDSEKFSESFFLVLLHYVGSTKSGIFI